MSSRWSCGLAVAILTAGCNPELFVFDGDASSPTLQATSCIVNDGSVCPLSTHCDPDSGMCVACVEDRNCIFASTPHCAPGLHECVQCVVDDDCPFGQTCDSLQCVFVCPDGGCFEDAATCGPGHPCLVCTSDADCSEAPYGRGHCNPDSGKCVECTGDDQCSGDASRCIPSQGICVECLQESDCTSPGHPICDEVHQCVAP